MKHSPCTRFDQAASNTHGNAMPAWKRATDISFCVLLLPILALCALMMTIITWLVSPGPLFFRQSRVGFRGRRFGIFKFRTMRIGANTEVHQHHFAQLMVSNAPMVKLDAQRDSRLIPGGWVLRAFGVDELPQIINVLLGDMSLVGPRPCMVNEFEQYSVSQRERVNAVPGLTGLWQVSGKNRTSFEKMIHLDLQYAREISLLRDLQIILRTPRAVMEQVLDIRCGRQSSIRAPSDEASQRFLHPTSVNAPRDGRSWAVEEAM